MVNRLKERIQNKNTREKKSNLLRNGYCVGVLAASRDATPTNATLHSQYTYFTAELENMHFHGGKAEVDSINNRNKTECSKCVRS